MKQTYFLSDLHLGASYIADPRAHERMVVEFLLSIKQTASQIFLLGDVLDYWYEYRTVVPRGHVRFFGALAELADAGVRIVWLTGNHDIWLFDYLRDEIGITVVDGAVTTTIDGQNFYLAHGDAVGDIPRGFQIIRTIFRNRFCQTLFSAIHPRWTVPFAHRWSSHSRSTGAEEKPFDKQNDSFIRFAEQYNRLNPDKHVDYFIFGHRHILVDEEVKSAGARVVILGDWIKKFTYARFADGILTVEKLKEKHRQ
ncbi:MAG: UDP-2,3-diacylglucosamine diphosphatase [Muribaculaceae bacterium]|nr:UDP-2,3-diacylglucosamine diphosphatase [Muribaculaceae bacterium]